MIIPSIDIINSKLVSLQQGKEKIIEFNNPLDFAKRFAFCGSDIQLIDLDAAMNKGNNLEIIKEICEIAKCRVGGGIRSIEKAKEIISLGADKIIIGTKANKEFLQELIKNIDREKIIVALDTKEGKISVDGWRTQTNRSPTELCLELEQYCSEFLYTCIDKEGLMQGSDYQTVAKLREITKNKISVAGGISTLEEIKKFDRINVDSVIGMAIYTGKLNYIDTFIETLDFDKCNSLIPTIAQDQDGNVLTLAYSSKESLKKAIETEKAWYFSRSRNKLWMKGETSGNTQEIISIKTDCDNDSLIFTVKLNGPACHLGTYSCFKGINKNFNLEALYIKINERIKSQDEKSYTKSLVNDPEVLKRKLIEEAAEVITAKDKSQLIWEAADLIYFLFVILANKGITIEDIEKENKRRDNQTNEKINKMKNDERGI